MQVFIRLLTGKTISFDVNRETVLLDVIDYANQYSQEEGTLPYQYNQIMVIQDYDNVLTVSKNKILEIYFEYESVSISNSYLFRSLDSLCS